VNVEASRWSELAEGAARNGVAKDIRSAHRARSQDAQFIRAAFGVIDLAAHQRAREVRLAPGVRAGLADLLG
jgi:hypothetical protein